MSYLFSVRLVLAYAYHDRLSSALGVPSAEIRNQSTPRGQWSQLNPLSANRRATCQRGIACAFSALLFRNTKRAHV